MKQCLKEIFFKFKLINLWSLSRFLLQGKPRTRDSSPNYHPLNVLQLKHKVAFLSLVQLLEVVNRRIVPSLETLVIENDW